MSVVFAKGFTTASIASGVSSVEGKKDLALVVNNGPLDAAAGVFTANRFCAASVQWSRKAIADGHLRGVVLNSGCANACTGAAGYKQSQTEAETFAELAGFDSATDVAVCSTGVIGALLPLDNLLTGMKAAFPTLSDSAEAGKQSSIAILTTDTKPKTVEIEGNGYRIGGMVKGSGMIAPQLATMLCVITTDAVVTSEQMQKALEHGAEYSFNRIDVDGAVEQFADDKQNVDMWRVWPPARPGSPPTPRNSRRTWPRPRRISLARSSAMARVRRMTSA